MPTSQQLFAAQQAWGYFQMLGMINGHYYKILCSRGSKIMIIRWKYKHLKLFMCVTLTFMLLI
jgi:hypothetical protein